MLLLTLSLDNLGDPKILKIDILDVAESTYRQGSNPTGPTESRDETPIKRLKHITINRYQILAEILDRKCAKGGFSLSL